MEPIQLSRSVKVEDRFGWEVPLEPVDEVVVLLLEARPIGQISRAKSNSQCLACVGGTDSHSGCANCRVTASLLQFLLLSTICLFMNLGDKLGASGDLQTAGVVNAILIELFELAEH